MITRCQKQRRNVREGLKRLGRDGRSSFWNVEFQMTVGPESEGLVRSWINGFPKRLSLAKVNDLNIFNTDEFSSVICESTVIIITKSDIVRREMDKYWKKSFFLYNIIYTDAFQWTYSFQQKLWGCWAWKESFKQFVGRCSLRPDFLVNQLWQLQMRRSPLLMIFLQQGQ